MADTEEKRPFAKSVVSTVTGEMKGGMLGALTGALIVGGLGALAGVAVGVAAPLIAGTAVTFGGVAAAAGLFAAGGAAIGGIFSAITGAYAGAVTGWVNSRPKGKDAVAQQQEKQIAYAQGMVQGVTLTKIEALEQQQAAAVAHSDKKWVNQVGGPKQEGQLFVEQEQQRQAAAALLNMQPQGRA